MTRVVRSSLLAFAVGCAMNPPTAGSAPPASGTGRNEALSACLTRSLSRDDRIQFAKWVFALMSLHPDVSSMANVTNDDRVALSKTTGGLFTSLITKTCAPEAREAMRVGGMTAIQNSFGVVGEAAMRELVSNPAVAGGFADFGKYVDSAEVVRVLMGNE